MGPTGSGTLPLRDSGALARGLADDWWIVEAKDVREALSKAAGGR